MPANALQWVRADISPFVRIKRATVRGWDTHYEFLIVYPTTEVDLAEKQAEIGCTRNRAPAQLGRDAAVQALRVLQRPPIPPTAQILHVQHPSDLGAGHLLPAPQLAL